MAMDAGLLPPLPFFSKKIKLSLYRLLRKRDNIIQDTTPAIKLGHCNTITSTEYVALIVYRIKENDFMQ